MPAVDPANASLSAPEETGKGGFPANSGQESWAENGSPSNTSTGGHQHEPEEAQPAQHPIDQLVPPAAEPRPSDLTLSNASHAGVRGRNSEVRVPMNVDGESGPCVQVGGMVFRVHAQQIRLL